MDRLYALVRVRGAKLRRRRLGYSPITIENVLLLFLSLSLSLSPCEHAALKLRRPHLNVLLCKAAILGVREPSAFCAPASHSKAILQSIRRREAIYRSRPLSILCCDRDFIGDCRQVRAVAVQLMEVVYGVKDNDWLVKLLRGMIAGPGAGDKQKKVIFRPHAFALKPSLASATSFRARRLRRPPTVQRAF